MEAKSIVINVRGFKFEVLLGPILKKSLPNTRLSKLCRHLVQLEPNKYEIAKLCDKHNEDLTEFFFECDPFIFNRILGFYQSGKLHFSHSECVTYICDELFYWQIEEDSLEDCCKTVYFEKSEEIEKTIQKEIALREKLNFRPDYGERLFPQLREKIWNIFEEPGSSNFAKIIFIFSILIAFLSVFDLIIHTIPELQLGPDFDPEPRKKNRLESILGIVEYVYISWFCFELVTKLICCPNKKKFILNFWNIIELASILPFFVWLLFSQYKTAFRLKQILSTLRILLLLKINRHSSSLKSFLRTIKNSFKQLAVLAVYLTVCVIFFSSIIHFFEKDSAASQHFNSIPASCWYGIVTILTVGYGDVVPATSIGKLFGSLCAISGLFIISLPVGIISINFARTLETEYKAKIFLKNEAKKRKLAKKIDNFSSQVYSEVSQRSEKMSSF